MYMKNTARESSASKPKAAGTVREIIQNARRSLSLTQAEFVGFLKEHHEVKTSQGLISKYESGMTNPPSDIIDICIEIIHDKNGDGDISLAALERRMKEVLRGPSQAGARKAFAVILDSLA
jgi:transcriptional regulator with XRE-family HTH domain